MKKFLIYILSKIVSDNFVLKLFPKYLYKCSICNGVYFKGWSDEEAADEYSNRFRGHMEEEISIVCDDCYNIIIGHDSASNIV